uniref:L27 domain-containing protein n=1 Tax=Knipowitschia caucasica TaxID=637954 RepID=A0AAV2LBN2_KNICA
MDSTWSLLVRACGQHQHQERAPRRPPGACLCHPPRPGADGTVDSPVGRACTSGPLVQLTGASSSSSARARLSKSSDTRAGRRTGTYLRVAELKLTDLGTLSTRSGCEATMLQAVEAQVLSPHCELGEQGLKQVLSDVLEEVRRTLHPGVDGAQIIHNLLNAPWLQSLLKVYECLQRFSSTSPAPALDSASGLSLQVLIEIRALQGCSEEAKELYRLMRQPHLQAVLSAHDVVAQKDYEPVLAALPEEVPDDEEEATRIVCLVKNKQPLFCLQQSSRRDLASHRLTQGLYSENHLCESFLIGKRRRAPVVHPFVLHQIIFSQNHHQTHPHPCSTELNSFYVHANVFLPGGADSDVRHISTYHWNLSEPGALYRPRLHSPGPAPSSPSAAAAEAPGEGLGELRESVRQAVTSMEARAQDLKLLVDRMSVDRMSVASERMSRTSQHSLKVLVLLVQKVDHLQQTLQSNGCGCLQAQNQPE